jgi:MFS family permease
MVGSGETYFGAYGVFLQATSLQIGLLASLPPFIGAIIQAFSVWVTDRIGSRRRIIVYGAIAQAFFLLLLSASAFVLPKLSNGPNLLILIIIFCFISANFTLPPWNSLIGDIVPANMRGIFFGIRTRQVSIFAFIGLILSGNILDHFRQNSNEAIGFAIIFFIAAISRFFSGYYLSKHIDPPYETDPRQYFSFYDFLRRARKSNFARFVFFFSCMNLGVAFAGPYFAQYMLRDLKLTYIEFTAVTAATVLGQFFTLRYWGNLSDTFGNKKVLNFCGYGVALCPFLWVFSANIWYLILIQLYGGFVWAGFNLAAQNFIFDAVSPPKRARCAAYTGIINGFFVFVGAFAGGYLASHLPHTINLLGKTITLPCPLIFLFIISGTVRFIAAKVFIPRFHEVREITGDHEPPLIFRINHLRPIVGAMFEIITTPWKKR